MTEQSLARIEHESSVQEYSVQDVVGQVAKLQLIMSNVMRENEHYGKIPGCGDKPTLLKPGAEKLCFTFRLAPRFFGEENPRDLARGHREYIIRCELAHIQTGLFIASGVGSCSTMEAKYRYRSGPRESTGKSVPGEYWNLRQSNPARAQEIIGGKGFSVAKENGKWEIVRQGERVEHDNPADHYNTVLKMAKKRAFVDAVLSATAASDIFTQDLEDLELGAHEPEPKAKPAAEPKKIKEEAPEPEQHELPKAEKPPVAANDLPCISDAQRKRMYAIARGSGLNDTQFREVLESMGYKSSKEVTKQDYEDICTHFESLKA